MTESDLELACLDWFQSLGYAYKTRQRCGRWETRRSRRLPWS